MFVFFVSLQYIVIAAVWLAYIYILLMALVHVHLTVHVYNFGTVAIITVSV